MFRFTSNQQAMLAESVNVRSWGNYVGHSQSKDDIRQLDLRSFAHKMRRK